MKTKNRTNPSRLTKATPITRQKAHEIQPFGHVIKMPIALSEKLCARSVENLNQVLADTITLRDLYKKHHWQVAGHTFYQLHLLFDKHFEEQSELVDKIAERIQLLGGISIAMAADVAETTIIPRPPRDAKKSQFRSRGYCVRMRRFCSSPAAWPKRRTKMAMTGPTISWLAT